LFEKRELGQARIRTASILSDPDSTVEIKFWASLQLGVIDYRETARSGRPGDEALKVLLSNARALQNLTASGPNHLKFYSLIAKHAAELGILVYEDASRMMAFRQHLPRGNPRIVLALYAKRSAATNRIVLKYNRCVRLARYAASYPDRWVLGRALTNIVVGIAPYLITLHSEGSLDAEAAFAQSALQVCKLAAWIGEETRDQNAVVMAITSALMTVQSEDSDAYRWGEQLARNLHDPEVRSDALRFIKRARKRWRDEPVEGDYQWDTTWQVIQKMAGAIGIDVSNENDPLVRSLRIAVKDDSPERVLVNCEHILASQGAVGPIAMRIQRLFNLGTAGSKVVHCTLHDYHKEGRELDAAYGEFKRSYCDSCHDKKPRPGGWELTEDVRRDIETRNCDFVARLTGTKHGLRYTDRD